ncbi:hypothetical protein CNR22_08720 [Sphingobacteriaceae bacterium]|nr:hypothetical protein CNR22_08720 [Sphingobacteriaceae bacterium]
MKKHLVILLAALSANLLSQTTIQLRHVEAGNVALAPNGIIYSTTKANKSTLINIDITNTSTVTNTYKTKRYDVILNNGADASFCFAGNCFASVTEVSPGGTTLNGGASASQSSTEYQMLTADIAEGSTPGISHIKYTIFNASNPSDSVQITIKYNVAAPVGIKEANKSLSSFEIFPNPAKENASILVNSVKSFESQVIVYNSIGAVVFQKQVSIVEGKNKIDLNIENLSVGIYFASIKTAEATVTKKLVVN